MNNKRNNEKKGLEWKIIKHFGSVLDRIVLYYFNGKNE